MSGIALIIPGADFSESPLGQVTFSKTTAERAAEVVEAYATAIGSHSYDDELVDLVVTLMRLGVWETMNVFPMLGSTITNKVQNLNTNSEIARLVYPDSVTLDNNELKFVQTLNPTEVGTLVNQEIVGSKNLFSFIDFNRTSIPPQRSLAIGMDAGTVGTAVGNIRIKFPNSVKRAEMLIPITLTERHSLGVYVDGDSLIAKGYIDGTNVLSESISNTSNIYRINNIIGTGPDPSVTENLYEGYIRFYAYGVIESLDKATATMSALQTFLNAVKPRS